MICIGHPVLLGQWNCDTTGKVGKSRNEEDIKQIQFNCGVASLTADTLQTVKEIEG
jgi:hypothetical protein